MSLSCIGRMLAADNEVDLLNRGRRAQNGADANVNPNLMRAIDFWVGIH
jgi:hypothetical protein